MDSGKEFAGKTVLVTGGGRNLGRAIVLEFAARGANVVINVHQNRAEAEAVAEEAQALGAEALVALGDVGNDAEVNDVVARALDRFGRVDISVSNAALRKIATFFDLTPEQWRRFIDVNLNASFYLAKAVVPGMVAAGWGRIIHMSGIDGFFGAMYPPHHRVYNVTAKAGLHGLTKVLASELGPHGITVNTIAPGVFNTSRDLNEYPEWNPTRMATEIPVRRIGEPDEIAWICAFLASERSGFINGQVIHSNGGQRVF